MNQIPAALLFDLDGVLVDTFEVWVKLLDDISIRLGYPGVPRVAVEKGWGQGVEADVERFYPRHTVDEIRALYSKHYGDHLESLKVMDGADGALRAWPMPKAVITNSPVAVAEKALSIGRLDGHFRTIVGSDSVAHSKPAPDMVLEACRRLEVTPDQALVVGDSRYDEEAARAAKVRFVLFKSFSGLKI